MGIIARSKPIVLTWINVGGIALQWSIQMVSIHFKKESPISFIIAIIFTVYFSWSTYRVWKQYYKQFEIVPYGGPSPNLWFPCRECGRVKLMAKGENSQALFFQCQWCGEEYQVPVDDIVRIEAKLERIP